MGINFYIFLMRVFCVWGNNSGRKSICPSFLIMTAKKGIDIGDIGPVVMAISRLPGAVYGPHARFGYSGIEFSLHSNQGQWRLASFFMIPSWYVGSLDHFDWIFNGSSPKKRLELNRNATPAGQKSQRKEKYVYNVSGPVLNRAKLPSFVTKEVWKLNSSPSVEKVSNCWTLSRTTRIWRLVKDSSFIWS